MNTQGRWEVVPPSVTAVFPKGGPDINVIVYFIAFEITPLDNAEK
jgi:hypothetical protein